MSFPPSIAVLSRASWATFPTWRQQSSVRYSFKARTPLTLTSVTDLNDDFFLMKPLSAADFDTPLYGPVFRMAFNLNVEGKPPGNFSTGVDPEGEWHGLEFSECPQCPLGIVAELCPANWLLGGSMVFIFRQNSPASLRRSIRQTSTSVSASCGQGPPRAHNARSCSRLGG